MLPGPTQALNRGGESVHRNLNCSAFDPQESGVISLPSAVFFFGNLLGQHNSTVWKKTVKQRKQPIVWNEKNGSLRAGWEAREAEEV